MLVFALVAKSKHPLKHSKINYLNEKFDTGQGHQLGCSSPFQSVRNRPRSAQKPLKNRHFRTRGV
jgi:hypothetical protein